MAQGFIDSSGSGDMEETGDLYFDELLRRSLLQDAEMDAEGNIYLCKMHDLVHDLAQFVAGSDCSIVVIRQQATLNLNNARHSLLCFSDEAGEVPSIPATLYKAHKLRTLLLDCRPFESRIFRVPHNLFHQLRCLRALNLSYTDIVKLPGTIGQMNHLRHLDLSYTGIEELPEEVSNCINLQALILNGCHWLRKLPSGMRKMISLRLLEFHNCYSLRYLPQGIGKLTALRKITKFIVGSGDKGCKCGELKHLNHLQGELEITGLENVRSRDDCREAELDKKQHLRALYLRYPYEGGEPLRGDEMTRMDHVLQGLQPHKNLKWFQLWNYQGSKFPKWIENPMFSNLVTVRLNFCGKCKQLPGLGKLPSLKYLYIYRMNEVTYVSGDFSGNNSNDGCGGGVLFPKLETLSFTEMPKWKEWELRGGDGQVMPSLIELELHNCRKLKVLHCNLLPLQKLTLDGINEMVLWRGPLPVLPNLNYLEILNIDELSSLPGGWLGQLKALQTLKIENCPQLGSLPEELGQLKALQTLKVENCPQLRSLPEELGQLEALQTLKVENCPQLGSLPEELGQLKALQNLQIENCTQVGTLPKELGQLKALQTLTIFKCQELRSLPVELEHLTMLQQLEIYDCQKLNPLPRNLSPLLEKLTLYKINNEMLLGGPLPLLPNLKNLVISNIDDLTSLPGAWLGQLKALQTLEIKWCPQLGSLPEELQLLTMLRELKIVGCPDLEERCQDGGEDWDKIAHIPHIKFSHF